MYKFQPVVKRIAVAAVVLFIAAGCAKNDTNNNTTPTTCNYNACAVVAPDSEVQKVQKYLADSAIANATKHCSGMYYVVHNAGTGKTPTPCNTVTVTYKGKLTNGNVFDQGTITYALSQLIRGWQNGLPLIKEGGSITLYIPPTLGYGNQDVKDNSGKVVIPANSVLIFDISLTTVQ